MESLVIVEFLISYVLNNDEFRVALKNRARHNKQLVTRVTRKLVGLRAVVRVNPWGLPPAVPRATM